VAGSGVLLYEGMQKELKAEALRVASWTWQVSGIALSLPLSHFTCHILGLFLADTEKKNLWRRGVNWWPKSDQEFTFAVLGDKKEVKVVQA
jgi:hypothetical protein